MFSTILKSPRLIFPIVSRSASKYRPMSPQLRFHLDTKYVYGAQRKVQSKRSTDPSELDLIPVNPKKNLFDQDTELLYGGDSGLHRACSIPKGISISERSRYLRQLFRIPRGQSASLYPQAYVPNKYLGVRRKKEK